MASPQMAATSTPEALHELIRTEGARWSRIIKDAGIGAGSLGGKGRGLAFAHRLLAGARGRRGVVGVGSDGRGRQQAGGHEREGGVLGATDGDLSGERLSAHDSKAIHGHVDNSL